MDVQRPDASFATAGHAGTSVASGGSESAAHQVRQILNSRLLDSSSAGPVLRGRRAPTRALRTGTLQHLLPGRDRVVVGALTAAWVVTFIAFWTWWLRPEHSAGWLGLALNSALLFYLSYLPSYFLIAVNRLPGVNPALPIPDVRVAFAVTKAPSEPWSVARTTLEAMLGQRFPTDYDVWLCDEDPTEETAQWCADHGVSLSSRHGVADYHQSHWPRRTKCKEGNLAYFYDHWGYRDYDVVAQLDCDHVPADDYLAEMVRPFEDPAIGYVAAPSVCDANASQSWTVRGRLHKEGTFHGAFQTGHNGGLAPLCIGSHYAVRTAALAEIGGVGPELAEDFSTSFLLNSAGWQGAFAHRVEAHGDGPLTFSAMVTQEYQWSRSLVTVMTNLLPRHLGRFSWALRFRFMFALSYYPLLSLATAAGLCLPAVAAVTGAPWVNVNYFEFLIRWSLLGLWLLAITAFVRRRGMLRPQKVPILSWENWLYTLARWPYIAWGVVAAVWQKIVPVEVGFKVTPKSRNGLEPLPTRLVLPYIGITVMLAGAALIGEFTTHTYGYVFLCLVASLSFALVSTGVGLLHAREASRASAVALPAAIRTTALAPLLASALSWIPLLVAIAAFPGYIAPILGYVSPLFGRP